MQNTSMVNSVLYKNQIDKFSDIQQDYYKVKNNTNNYKIHVDNISKLQHDYFYKNNKLKFSALDSSKDNNKSDNNNKINIKKELSSLLDILPMYRRVERVPDKLEKSDNIPAAGLAVLAILNGPEDIRDTISSYKQIKAKITKKRFRPSYNYKYAQHPFSFFRGTLLHSLVDEKTSPFPDLAKWLVKQDTTLWKSKLGDITSKIFDIETKLSRTRIRNLASSPKFIKAQHFITNNRFGEYTARALNRTTKIGAMALAAIETAHFSKEVNDGKSVKSEIAQSLITYISSLACIGYIGAIGAKHHGPTGSLVGMGLGSMIANRISNYFDT